MARISYTGDGLSLYRLLNHSPAVMKAHGELEKATRDGAIARRTRLLTMLAVDRTNNCPY